MKIKFIFKQYENFSWWCGNPDKLMIHYAAHISCSRLLKEHQFDLYYSKTLKRFLERMVKYEN